MSTFSSFTQKGNNLPIQNFYQITMVWVLNLMILSRTGSFLLFEWLIFIFDHFTHSLNFHTCLKIFPLRGAAQACLSDS